MSYKKTRKINKAAHITGKILCGVGILLIGLVVLIQLPGIQTKLADKFIRKIQIGLGCEISLESIRIRPFNRVLVSGLTIIDDTPLECSKFEAQDTVAHIRKLVAYCSLGSLVNPDNLTFRRIRLDNAYFCLVDEGPEMTNAKRCFTNSSPKETSRKSSKKISVHKLEANGLRFRMLSVKDTKVKTHRDVIDWTDMDVTADVRARNIKVVGKNVTAIADRVSLSEKSGYCAERISADVLVTPMETRIENIRLTDMWSDLNVPLYAMHYNGGKSFKYYCSDISMEGLVGQSHLDFRTLHFFAYGISDTDISLNIEDASMHGPVDDLTISTFVFNSLSGIDKRTSDIKGNLAVGIKNVRELRQGSIKADISELSYPYKGHVFHLRGKAEGPAEKLSLNLEATSDIGSASVSGIVSNIMKLKTSPLVINGNLSTRDLVLGAFLDEDFIKECTVKTSIRASLQKGNTSVTVDSLKAERLNIHDYDYTGVNAAGTFSDNAFDGRIICGDPNLNFIFQGLFNLSKNKKNAIYKFYFNLGYANLNAINLDKRGISKASFTLDADYMRIDEADLLGNIDINSLILENAAGKHNIGSISIGSHSNDNIYRLNFNSTFADASYVGSKSIGLIPEAIREVALGKELPSLFGEASDKWGRSNCELKVNFHDSRDVLSFLIPGLYIADSTSVSLGIGIDGALKGELASSRLAYNKQYIKGVNLQFDNADGSLNGKLAGDEIMVSGVTLANNSLILFADNNHIGAGFEFDNSKDSQTKGELLATGEFSRDASGALTLNAENLASNLYYEDIAWRIDPSDFVWEKGESLQVDSLRIWSDEQEVFVNGRASSNKQDTLLMNISKLNLGTLGQIFAPEMGIKGKATGKVMLLSAEESNHSLLVNFSSDSTFIAGRPAGQLKIGGSWDKASDMMEFAISNLFESDNNIHVFGRYSPGTHTVNASSTFSDFNLGYIEPLSRGILSSLDGRLSGGLDVKGRTDSLIVSGNNLNLKDTRIKVQYTNVPYVLNGSFNIDNNGIHFDDISLKDENEGSGILNGGILFNDFKKISLDAGIDASILKVLNTTQEDNSTFYGDLTANGRISFTGPLDAVSLNIDVTTANPGRLHIPMGGKGKSTGTSKILTFKEAYKYVWIDPYIQMMETLNTRQKKEYDLGVKLNVNVTNDVETLLEIDKETGNTLSGRGTGNIRLDVRPSRNVFNINGDYNLRSGNVHINAMDIAEKDFSIQDGSSIKFNGDIQDSDLDITALYSTKASLSSLIADSTSVSTRRTVDCGIRVYDKLKDPQFKFSINIRDLDPTIKSRVETALNTEDKLQKQFISLLVTNNFIPDEQSGIFNNSSNMIFSNVSNILANQLNNVLEKLEIPVDLGLSYQNIDGGTNIFDVAISTQLFNNRVLVNGAIGNRQHKHQSSNNVVGDLDIEIKLDRAGAVRMSLFSHSADEYTNYLDNLQRNGIGIAYQREFNSFKELWTKLFTRKRENAVTTKEKRKIIIE